MSSSSRQRDGQVLTFSSRGVKPRRSALVATGERGTVLLFTGVRYERQVGDEPIVAAAATTAQSTDQRIGA